MKKFTTWLVNVLIAIDQLGNAIAGGNPDVTISARVGYFSLECKDNPLHFYWRLLEIVIDTTFYPLDGPDHCLSAYQNDAQEHHILGSDLARGLLGLIVIASCTVIVPITWTLYLLGQRPE